MVLTSLDMYAPPGLALRWLGLFCDKLLHSYALVVTRQLSKLILHNLGYDTDGWCESSTHAEGWIH